MTPLTATSVLRRFLVLTALRWLPPGLLIPVIVLLPLDRGLNLGQLGLAFAMQGLLVFALELPTGGLADSVGRRSVLLASMVVSIASIGLLLVAESFAAFAVVYALQGIYRALDSGPLQAWYVDAALAADPEARIDKGMSGHGTVLGLSVAAGAVTSGGLVALDPVPALDALVTPVALALLVQVIGMVAVAALMSESPPATGRRRLAESILATPRTITTGVRLLRSSPVLLALVAVELFWGFGMTCFESLLPVRLSEVAGGAEVAAAITGPAASAAWLASAAGAAVTPWFGRRFGVAPAAAIMRITQGIAVAGMGFFAGVPGILVAYLTCYAVHGASNAAHMTLLHRQVTGGVRATVVSLNSMASQPAGALGAIALTALAEATSVSTSMYLGAVVLAAAAPLYLPARRQSRQSRAEQSRAQSASPLPTPATSPAHEGQRPESLTKTAGVRTPGVRDGATRHSQGG